MEGDSQPRNCCDHSSERGWREMNELERDLGGRIEWTWDMEGQGLGAGQREVLRVIPRLLVR